MFLMKLTSFSFQPPLTQVKKMRPLKGPPWQGRELASTWDGPGESSPRTVPPPQGLHLEPESRVQAFRGHAGLEGSGK